jgi:hypothetical protein
MAELELLLAKREALAEEMTQVVGRLGELVHEEKKVEEQLRRRLVQTGIKAEPFSTHPDFETTISSELGRTGMQVWRVASPWGPRLTEVVGQQHRTIRARLHGSTKAA